MKIIFFGSSNYCIPILESINNNFNLVTIITKKGQSVEKFAQSHNIKAYTPVNKEELINLKNDISSLKPDLAIVADYGLLIPKEIFSIPHYQTLNIHFSKLPKLRGPSPVQYTILMGEKSAWISVIIMDEEMDTGDIIWQKEIPLINNQSTNQLIIQSRPKDDQPLAETNSPIKETTESLYQKLFNIAAMALPDVIKKYINRDLKPQKQDHSLATYTKHFSREDGFIPPQLLDMAIKGTQPSREQFHQWKLSTVLLLTTDTNARDRLHPYQLAFLVDRVYQALSPWPGLWTLVEINHDLKHPGGDKLSLRSSDSPGVDKPEQRFKKRLKILKTHLEDKKLVLDIVQLEGKKPVSWKQFLQGYPNSIFTNYKRRI